jgi:hypothetical protein
MALKTKTIFNPLAEAGFQKLTTEVPSKIQEWTISTDYELDEIVTFNGLQLKATVTHTSDATSIDADINSNRWATVDGNGYIASNVAGFGQVGMAGYLGVSGGNPAVYRARATGDMTELADGIMIAGGSARMLVRRFGNITLPTAIWDARTGQTGGLTSGSLYYLSNSFGNYSVNPPFNENIKVVLRAITSTNAEILVNNFTFVPTFTKRVSVSGTWTAQPNEVLIEGSATVVNLYDLASYINYMESVTIRNTGTVNMQINPFAGNTIRGQSHMILGPGGSCEITKDITPTNWVVMQKSDIAIWDNTKNYAVGDVVRYQGTVIGNNSYLPMNVSKILFTCSSDYIGGIDTTVNLPRPSNFRPMDKDIEWAIVLNTGVIRKGAFVHYQNNAGSTQFYSSIATAVTTVSSGIIIEVDNNNAFFVLKTKVEVVIATAQWDAVTGQTGGLTAGQYYILSQTTPGNIQVADVTSGVRQVVGLALNTTVMQLLFDPPTVL